MRDRKITVSLSCATCGGADFDFNEDKSFVRCETCNREYLGGYDELVEFNQEQIGLAVQNMKVEVGKEIRDDFEKSLKNIFKGNKFIKIK
jgi:DNA-directed RNA polymerase subunit RPC12/RpoP